MDLIDVTIKGFHEQTMRHKATRIEQIREVRAKQEAVSKQRMAEFQRIEMERRADILRNKVDQQKQDRRNLILTGTLIFGVLIVLVGIALSF
ncbi:MAG: hypothetical protein AAF902_14295 [Chloroflexota bacterium]